MKIDKNALILQTFKLPDCSNEVRVKANGMGSALVQLVSTYNIYKIELKDKPSFVIEQRSPSATKNKIDLQTCVSYNGKTSTGMVLVESTLLSGYEINKAKLDKLKNTVVGLMLVEVKNKDTIVFYFDPFEPGQFVCFYWSMFFSQDLSDLKPVPVKVYDYYDTTLQASTLFNPPTVTTKSAEIVKSLRAKKIKIEEDMLDDY